MVLKTKTGAKTVKHAKTNSEETPARRSFHKKKIIEEIEPKDVAKKKNKSGTNPIKKTGSKTKKIVEDIDAEEKKGKKNLDVVLDEEAIKKTVMKTKKKKVVEEIEEEPKEKKKKEKEVVDEDATKKTTKNKKKKIGDDAINKQLVPADKKNNKILEVKTTQTAAFKQSIERISYVISDCCIVFIPKDKSEKNTDDDDYYEEINDENPLKTVNTKNQLKRNTGGIRVLRLTEDKCILIKLSLDADNFESFRCDLPKITIGVDMHNLNAQLKSINDDDPMIMYMNKDDRSVFRIRSVNENNESSEETEIEIYLMEIPNPEMPIPQAKFQQIITMASDKFHTICKHLNNNSTCVEITSINHEIIFRGHNEGGRVTMSYKDTNYNLDKKGKKEQVFQGLFELRNLMSFSKCNKLCNTIQIYLKNDFPLVLVIPVATLGRMYIFLTPIEDPAD